MTRWGDVFMLCILLKKILIIKRFNADLDLIKMVLWSLFGSVKCVRYLQRPTLSLCHQDFHTHAVDTRCGHMWTLKSGGHDGL